MLEYHKNTLCISANELVDCGIMSMDNYKKMAARGKLTVARQGKGQGNYALVVVDSLPTRFRSAVIARYPEGCEARLRHWFEQNYQIDQAAVAFYSSPSQCGLELPAQKITEYVNNASVLTACIRLYNNTKAVQRTMGKAFDWSMMASVVEAYRTLYQHTLPSSMLRFRKRAQAFQREGYGALISGKFGNQSARKVDHQTERLILGLACLPNKPFDSNVAEMYNAFVCGELDVYDPQTGELFNPEDFCDAQGEPKALSEATISNYLNKPKNQLLIHHKLDSWTTFYHEQMPHVHRHAPEFSFSKITLDDRDLPRKLKDSKARPKAYYAYDVTSQAVVGYAYNRKKSVDLVVEMFRSMFRLIDQQGWGCPAEVEVEHHLMSQWRESFLKAGEFFPFVRFCAPTNSQEKYAEALNGAKKKRIEHRNHIGIGRFYGKGKWRAEGKKVFDADNDTYHDTAYYSWEQLIAEDMADIAAFNNSLHPNQKRYQGLTRWQVLVQNLNPTLRPIDRPKLAYYIGESVATSIRRNSYCTVVHRQWWLSSPEVLGRLAPNNLNVTAHYLPTSDGEVAEVHLYQNDRYIDTLTPIATFNRARCEQTEADRSAFTSQMEVIGAYKKLLKNEAIAPVAVQTTHLIPEAVEVVAAALPDTDFESTDLYPLTEDYAQRGLQHL